MTADPKQSRCAIDSCKTSIFNKGANTTFHSIPSAGEIRNKWITILKNRCSSHDWSKMKICSKHFEVKYFDSPRKLKSTAIPTMFPVGPQIENVTGSKSKVDKLINKLTQQQLTDDILDTIRLVKVPDDFSDCVGDDLQCIPSTPVEAQLWLLVKKQDHLISRLTQAVTQNKKHVNVLQKNLEEIRSNKKNMEQQVESYKYIVKCLQEKQATLEEQIEILTAVEAR